jgi:hypothetical protein
LVDAVTISAGSTVTKASTSVISQTQSIVISDTGYLIISDGTGMPFNPHDSTACFDLPMIMTGTKNHVLYLFSAPYQYQTFPTQD